jgi:tetratricopeptide (TPR) repeat protein
MTRAVAHAALFGVLLGACALMPIAAVWKNPALPAPEVDSVVAARATEAWPICTSMGSFDENAGWAQLDPDFALGLKALSGENWTGAISMRHPQRCAMHAMRIFRTISATPITRLRQLDAAFEHYRLALTLNPRQRNAHEHLGEAYLVVGNLAKAQEHLAALERICLVPCEQYDGLKKAIDKFSSRDRRGSTDPAL